MLAHALGGPSYSFTAHGTDDFDNPQHTGIREKVRRSAFVVAVSSYGRSQFYRWVDYEQWHKINVVHCGLGPEYFSIEATQFPAKRRLVCVGRLCKEKGQMLLVEAANRLARSGMDFELVLAGDGEMRTEIEDLIGRYCLVGKIRITGWISGDQVRTEILAAQAFVLPSFAEGLPVAIMEAMALRRPVLTTYVAGIPELVCPDNGWLIPAGSVEHLTAAIEAIFSTPVKELVRMGELAYLRALDRHSINKEVIKLAGLLRKCLE